MAQRTINIGTAPNTGDGEGLRNAGSKINANFTELYSSLSTASAIDTLLIARATQISATQNIVMTGGYRTAGDGGGASYIRSTGATSIPIGGFQSADGAYWSLNGDTANIKAFGAYGDGTLHTISADDLTANPQWMGPYTDTGVTTYSAGYDSWDSVAAQEMHYWALASLSTSSPRVFTWNQPSHLRLNCRMYVPTGTYIINRRVFGAGTGFTFEFETRKTTIWNWAGTLTILGDTHTSTTIDNITSPMGQLEKGQYLRGSGFAAGTKITAINTVARSITLSNATTSSLTQTQFIAFAAMLLWDSASYIFAKNVSMQPAAGYQLPRAAYYDTGDVIDDNHGSFTALWVIDHDSNSPVGLSPQNSVIQEMFMNGKNNVDVGLSISPTGGGAQGSEFLLVHPFMASFKRSAIQINGGNAIADTILRGDFQFCLRDAVSCLGGSVIALGTTTENWSTSSGTSQPIICQPTSMGADFNLNTNSGQFSDLTAIRAEGCCIVRSVGDNAVLRNSNTLSVDGLDAYREYPFTLGSVVNPTSNNTLKRMFVCVDTGGTNTWKVAASGAGNTFNDPTSSYTVNEWAGKAVYFRFGSNGFTDHDGITSNTATSITSASTYGDNANAATLYTITGATAVAYPNFDACTAGTLGDSYFNSNGQGITLTAGSVTAYGGSAQSNIQVGDYIVVPNADIVGVGPEVFAGFAPVVCPFIAEVLAIVPGGPQANTYTLSKAPARSMFEGNYYSGTPLVDGDIKWIHLDFATVAGIKEVENSTFGVGRGKSVQRYRNTAFSQLTWYSGDVSGSIRGPYDLSSAVDANILTQPLPTTTPLDLTPYMTAGNVSQLTPTGDQTLNAPTPISGIAQEWLLQITTSGVTSRNITFGTNFVSSGVLATGTVSGANLSVRFVSNGTKWVEQSRYPVTVVDPSGWRTLKQVNVAQTVVGPGTTVKTTTWSMTVPGGTVGATGRLRVTPQFRFTGTAGTKTATLDYGGTSFYVNAFSAPSLNAAIAPVGFANRGSVSSQIGLGVGLQTGLGQTTTDIITAAINTAADQTLSWSITLANTADSGAVESVLVEYNNDNP